MALSSSGSISLGQIQTEYGGSNPASVNEYYIGSLLGNSSSPNTSPQVSGATSSVYNPGSKFVAAYTTYYESNGWKNNNISIGQYNVTGTTQSAIYSVRTGVDHVGNAGQIPSSGAIQFNHFRGTNAPTTTNYTVYGGLHTRAHGGLYPGGPFTVWIGGHWGPTNQGGIFGGSWTGVPFSYITTAAIGSPQMPATNWGGYTNVSLGGANQGYGVKTHQTYPNIGNVTQFGWTSNGAYDNFSGFWSTTIYF